MVSEIVNGPVKLPPIGQTFSDHITYFHEQRGLNPVEAREHGDAIAKLVLDIFAGEKVGFPADPYKEIDLEERNRKICEKYDGKNVLVLAKAFGLSRQTIYRIVTSKD